MPPIKATHVLTVEIPLAIDPDDIDKPTDAELLTRGKDALEDMKGRGRLAQYQTGDFQITVKEVP